MLPSRVPDSDPALESLSWPGSATGADGAAWGLTVRGSGVAEGLY